MIVQAVISSNAVDAENQIIPSEVLFPELQKWQENYGNVRGGYGALEKPVGKATGVSLDRNGLVYATIQVVDPETQEYIRKGVYTHAVLGLANWAVVKDPDAKGGRFTRLNVLALHLTDGASNPDNRFLTVTD